MTSAVGSAFPYSTTLRYRAARPVTEVFSSHIVGSPSTVKAGLEALAQRTGADEIMIATIMHGYQDRLRSYELIADACLPRRERE